MGFPWYSSKFRNEDFRALKINLFYWSIIVVIINGFRSMQKKYNDCNSHTCTMKFKSQNSSLTSFKHFIFYLNTVVYKNQHILFTFFNTFKMKISDKYIDLRYRVLTRVFFHQLLITNCCIIGLLLIINIGKTFI